MLRNTGLIILDRGVDAYRVLDEVKALPIVAVDISFNEQTDVKPILLLVGTEKIHYVFDLRKCGTDVLNDFFVSKSLKVMASAYDKVLKIYRYKEMNIENITDILILEQLIVNNYFFQAETKDLDELSDRYLGFRPDKGKRILLDNLTGELSEKLLEYLRIELLVIYRIFLEQVKKIKSASLERVSRLESNLIKNLAMIQHRGIYFDLKGFRELFSGLKGTNLFKDEMTLDEDEVSRIFAYGAKGDFRLLSLIQEFEKQYKDPAHVLCQNANEIIRHITLPESRIHSRFIQISSASGRTSSQSPNLFAIPKARIFREYFSAPPDKVLITLDFSTFELGVLAALSKDPHFLKAFRERMDLHSYVAQLMFGKNVSKTENSELRTRAKAINFGIIYGMTSQGLAKRLGIDKKEASKLINTYYMVFPSLHSYIQNLIATSIKNGELRTLTGRRCLLTPFETLTEARRQVLGELIANINTPNNRFYGMLLLKGLEEEYFKKEIPSEEMYIKRLSNVIAEKAPLKKGLKDIDYKIQEIYRFIRNMPIQGTAADIMKLSINRVCERLIEKGLKAFIVNIVHDEILVESDINDALEVASLAKETMIESSRQILKEIEIGVDVSIGKFWGDSSLNKLIKTDKN